MKQEEGASRLTSVILIDVKKLRPTHYHIQSQEQILTHEEAYRTGDRILQPGQKHTVKGDLSKSEKLKNRFAASDPASV